MQNDLICPCCGKPKKRLAEAWSGHCYGRQALKPAVEPIILFQKPYSGRPVDSITSTGAGALNIDSARIRTTDNLGGRGYTAPVSEGWDRPFRHREEDKLRLAELKRLRVAHAENTGRWPSNFLLQHSPDCVRVGETRVRGSNAAGGGGRTFGGKDYTYKEWQILSYTDSDGLESIEEWECETNCPIRLLNEQAGERITGNMVTRSSSVFLSQHDGRNGLAYSDNGNTHASRFFHNSDWSYEIEERIDETSPVYYCAKAGRRERDLGLDEFPARHMAERDGRDNTINSKLTLEGKPQAIASPAKNFHPTSKPLKLCAHLASLLSPPVEYAPRRLLIPFMGSGSEAIGAILSGGWEEIVGIEMSKEYCEIAEARLSYWSGHTPSQKKLVVPRKIKREKNNKPEQLEFGLT